MFVADSVVVSHTVASFAFFFFNDTATTEIYTLSLHDALPISDSCFRKSIEINRVLGSADREAAALINLGFTIRSEEHTSELQSQSNLVCRLLLEKKNQSDIQIVSFGDESIQRAVLVGLALFLH